jgi:hypothetical protein
LSPAPDPRGRDRGHAALAEPADILGASYHVGVTLSVDSDFAVELIAAELLEQMGDPPSRKR